MKIEFDAEDQGWAELQSEQDLLNHYPRQLWGHYRPQPWLTPDKYPCLFREAACLNNSHGADHAVLEYIYDYKKIDDETVIAT